MGRARKAIARIMMIIGQVEYDRRLCVACVECVECVECVLLAAPIQTVGCFC
jgi:hypothetical protein